MDDGRKIGSWDVPSMGPRAMLDVNRHSSRRAHENAAYIMHHAYSASDYAPWIMHGREQTEIPMRRLGLGLTTSEDGAFFIYFRWCTDVAVHFLSGNTLDP